MKTYLAYGAAFSNSRSQLELNVREMADLLGISHGFLSKIETGFQPPNAELCKRLEHVAGIDLDSTIQSYIAEAKEETGFFGPDLHLNPDDVQEDMVICWKADVIRKKEKWNKLKHQFDVKFYQSLQYHHAKKHAKMRIDEAYLELMALQNREATSEDELEKAEKKLFAARHESNKLDSPNIWSMRKVQEKKMELAFLKSEIEVLENEISAHEKLSNEEITQENSETEQQSDGIQKTEFSSGPRTNPSPSKNEKPIKERESSGAHAIGALDQTVGQNQVHLRKPPKPKETERRA